ncbi:helix-turn-helix domain-containing protein [Fulvivirga sp. M361]|uniref:helix-turn-helix domain-containing protein n=1 Tax=Fulvivirga sp. M361 TaxID=2594266 RepID=UPI001179EB11|nr:helix-turn-helix domain-containing protein [Fulvivirga sp. M361]TRX47046.1 helix-turn-helix domain-containing protein [Fulvivirga sp. M361]
MELSEVSYDKALLFLFSAIGALNTFFLTFYFLFFVKSRGLHIKFLASLLFVIGLREGKSVLILFLENGIEIISFFGQSVDTLIGPFLFLYVSTCTSGSQSKGYRWIAHTLPYLSLMVAVFLFIKYKSLSYFNYTTPIGGIIYIQWITYIILAARRIMRAIRKLFNRQKLEKNELWMVTLVGSVFVIWLAYLLTHFGNFILGGVSISVVLYLSIIFGFYGRRSDFYEAQPKYGSKKIPDEEARRILSELNTLMVDHKLHIDPTIKLADIASKLNISTHRLSQILNDNLQSSFNHYINQFRIQAATEMIKKNHSITLEAIGVDCGFKSKSAFYAAFKSIHQQTPAQFRKAHLSN